MMSHQNDALGAMIHLDGIGPPTHYVCYPRERRRPPARGGVVLPWGVGVGRTPEEAAAFAVFQAPFYLGCAPEIPCFVVRCGHAPRWAIAAAGAVLETGCPGCSGPLHWYPCLDEQDAVLPFYAEQAGAWQARLRPGLIGRDARRRRDWSKLPAIWLWMMQVGAQRAPSSHEQEAWRLSRVLPETDAEIVAMFRRLQGNPQWHALMENAVTVGLLAMEHPLVVAWFEWLKEQET